MKKIIVISLLSLMSSVYAIDVAKDTVESKIHIQGDSFEMKQLNLQSFTKPPSNKTFLYEFDFSQVEKSDKSTYKYVTNNTNTVATNKALEEVMKKNWNLSSDYSKNLKLNSEQNIANKVICRYNNGLVIKIKAHGEYLTNCPLKYMV